MGEDDIESWLGKQVEGLIRQLAPHFEDPEELTGAFRDDGHGDPTFTRSLTLSDPSERELLLFSGPILSEAGEERGRVWVTRDVSDERRLEERLRQSQKLETLGTLAGGVAHDFNNQLMAILGNARLLLSSVGEDSDARESLLDVERAAEHCADLTRSLLAFARLSSVSMSPVDPTAIVDELDALMRSMLPDSIHFETITAPELPHVKADPAQLHQILFNLAVNAWDAAEASGRILLEARPRTISDSAGRENRDGDYVEFSVTDDGSGMDARTRARIFEPFFTTRSASEGRGLGLAVVYGAVRAHEGWVEVESAPGAGSTFRVLIPVTVAADRARTIDAGESVSSGGETILLADDESMLRRVARLMLERYGFRVIEACDGLEAVSTFEERQREIDLLLLDVTMPNLDGLTALERMRETAPGIPAILTSGRPESISNFTDPRLTVFLPKPYEARDLVNGVRRILDTNGHGADGRGGSRSTAGRNVR